MKAKNIRAHKDPRVDAYIENAADFAKPVLNHLRKLVHEACPDVEETIKWGFPNFLHHGILCSMAAFKQHCAFLFWKGSRLSDPTKILDKPMEQGMGQLGRITSVKELPSQKILIAYLKELMKLNEAGILSVESSAAKTETPKSSATKKKELKIPKELAEALKKNKKAAKMFEAFSPSHQKEYAEWIAEAKAESTRSVRLKTAMEWIEEGKPRNWKYMKRK